MRQATPEIRRRRISNSQEARFSALYQRHYNKIYAYCRRRTGLDQVDDVVADVFMSIWRRIDDVPQGDEALPWLYGVAYRTLANHWRVVKRRNRTHRILRGIAVDKDDSPDDIVVVREEVQQVLKAASRLKPGDLEILRLALWEELPRKDIAGVLGVTESAVNQRLYRAKLNLEKQHKRLQSRTFASPVAWKGGAW